MKKKTLKNSPQKEKVGPKKKKLFGQEDQLPVSKPVQGTNKLKVAVKKYFKV